MWRTSRTVVPLFFWFLVGDSDKNMGIRDRNVFFCVNTHWLQKRHAGCSAESGVAAHQTFHRKGTAEIKTKGRTGSLQRHCNISHRDGKVSRGHCNTMAPNILSPWHVLGNGDGDFAGMLMFSCCSRLALSTSDVVRVDCLVSVAVVDCPLLRMVWRDCVVV